VIDTHTPVEHTLHSSLINGLSPAPAVDLAWSAQIAAQRQALESPADEILFGGQAGGGKTDLLLGAAVTRHRRSVIFRRKYVQLRAIISRSKEIIGRLGHYNHTERRWELEGGRELEFGGLENEDDKLNWQGRPHDFYGFDELTQLSLTQYLFVIAWLRTTTPGQRTRIIGASNPPLTSEGLWVLERWAAWLDRTHPDPAAPGELRWYVRIRDTEHTVKDGTPIRHEGEIYYPKSRTFIPARLQDNAFLMHDPQYLATLQALPAEVRVPLLTGDFMASRADDPFQVIPTEWIEAAQARWQLRTQIRGVVAGPKGEPVPLTRLGVDVAEGGGDRTVIGRLYGDWLAPLEVYPGSKTPTPIHTADLVIAAIVGTDAVAAIDYNGVGQTAYNLLAGRQVSVVPYIGSSKTKQRDRSGQLGFYNVRAAAHWQLRERLDPAFGPTLCVPPGQEILRELSAARYILEDSNSMIRIEKKDAIAERLGRSPDLSDGIVMTTYVDAGELAAARVGHQSRLATGIAPKPKRQPKPEWVGAR
jgi:hypothetical protein